jgi:hypothetical protein
MTHRIAATLFALANLPAFAAITQVRVSVDRAAHAEPVTGRLVLVLSRRETPEPRFQIAPNAVPLFAVDVSRLTAGQEATLAPDAIGHPVESLAQLPAGEYFAQAVLNIYSEYHRSDGHNVWVHFDMDGAPFQISAGNLYSDVKKVRIDPRADFDLQLLLNHVVTAPAAKADTKWIKHVRIQSEKLSKFWGAPVYLGATVLLPKGYDEHPSARYPVAYVQGYLGAPAFQFNDDSSVKENAEAAHRRGLQTGYEFYQSWNSDHFPRFLAVTFVESTPFFPDGYNINSANSGPYGDAITQELIPYVEKHFRAIGKPYARTLEGASTGGWGSLALQLHHPEMFGGAWVYYPDPIDFRRYQMINIYEDENAFKAPGAGWVTGERPMRRADDGQVTWTIREMSKFEELLGTKGRSQYQFEGWEAYYGPAGKDGYPRPLWDKLTGKIDREVALSMRDHGYDLRDYAENNWAKLGHLVAGKIHFICGDMDNFYLNLAVYLFEDFSKAATNPASGFTFEYGRPMKGHWWHPQNWADVIRAMAKQVSEHAPKGETTEWLNY